MIFLGNTAVIRGDQLCDAILVGKAGGINVDGVRIFQVDIGQSVQIVFISGLGNGGGHVAVVQEQILLVIQRLHLHCAEDGFVAFQQQL